jgi:hypothetical protein
MSEMPSMRLSRPGGDLFDQVRLVDLIGSSVTTIAWRSLRVRRSSIVARPRMTMRRGRFRTRADPAMP